METRLLRYFLAVAQEKNITRAAESLHISQPSLSKQMTELEQRIGKRLFIRGKRSLALTDDGVLLYRRADEILALMQKTEEELSSGAARICGEIAIGGTPTASVMKAAAALRGEHPDVRFRFYSGDATDVTERLEHGSLDFAVLLEPVDSAKYDYRPLNDSARWGLLMPRNAPAAKKQVAEREDILNVPLIMHHRAGLQREIARWARTEVERLNVAADYNVVYGDPSAFVKSGLGYLLITDDHLPRQPDPALCFRPLFPALEVRNALVWKRRAVFGKAAAAFLKTCENMLAGNDPAAKR